MGKPPYPGYGKLSKFEVGRAVDANQNLKKKNRAIVVLNILVYVKNIISFFKSKEKPVKFRYLELL